MCESLTQLESLEIQNWMDFGLEFPQAQLTAGFVALRSLQRLKLEMCGHVDRCLVALLAVPSLRRLIIKSYWAHSR